MSALIETSFSVELFKEEASSVKVKSFINDAVSYAKDLIVKDESSYGEITSLYKKVRSWEKDLDYVKKKLLEPFKKEISNVNDKIKEFEIPLQEIVRIANEKTGAYQSMLEEKRKKDDDELNEALSFLDCYDQEAPIPVSKTLKGNGASTITITRKKFRVTDMSKIPVEYLLVNDVLINKMINNGIKELSGIEIYEEKKTQLRTT